MTTKELIEEKAFIAFRNQIHAVAEEVKETTLILIYPHKEIPERLMNHLLDQRKCNGITFRDSMEDLGNDKYIHNLLIFKDFALES